MTQDEIAAIAKGLTATQRDALCGIFSSKTPWEQEWTETVLYSSHLWKQGLPKRGESILTPLGMQVRAYLLRKGA